MEIAIYGLREHNIICSDPQQKPRDLTTGEQQRTRGYEKRNKE